MNYNDKNILLDIVGLKDNPEIWGYISTKIDKPTKQEINTFCNEIKNKNYRKKAKDIIDSFVDRFWIDVEVYNVTFQGDSENIEFVPYKNSTNINDEINELFKYDDI